MLESLLLIFLIIYQSLRILQFHQKFKPKCRCTNYVCAWPQSQSKLPSVLKHVTKTPTNDEVFEHFTLKTHATCRYIPRRERLSFSKTYALPNAFNFQCREEYSGQKTISRSGLSIDNDAHHRIPLCGCMWLLNKKAEVQTRHHDAAGSLPLVGGGGLRCWCLRTRVFLQHQHVAFQMFPTPWGKVGK